jgi:hypothetical protein
MSSTVLDALTQASKGLEFPSESEYPFEPFLWKGDGTALTSEQIIQKAGLRGTSKTKVVDLDSFFQPATEEQDWFGPEEKETMKKFRNLVQVLKANLKDIQVLRAGKTEIEVVILGRTCDGDWAGLKTRVVET